VKIPLTGAITLNWRCQESYLEAEDIRDRWIIQNPLLGSLNSERVNYKIWQGPDSVNRGSAVFYLHGFGGNLDDTPFLEDIVCPHTRMIRVQCFGLSSFLINLAKGSAATFGDVCTLLHNGRQGVYSIADLLDLESYAVVAHSWGGFIASLAALNDTRCKKAMLLVSTPNICDALSRIYEFTRLPERLGWAHDILIYGLKGFFGPFSIALEVFSTRIPEQAKRAKVGKSSYQDAWDNISPYGEVMNPGIEMLIFNRDEDRVMTRSGIEQFITQARYRGITGIDAEFSRYSGLHWHDMPLENFSERLEKFLFGGPLKWWSE